MHMELLCIHSQLNKLAQIFVTEITLYTNFQKHLKDVPRMASPCFTVFKCCAWLLGGPMAKGKNRNVVKVNHIVVKSKMILYP